MDGFGNENKWYEFISQKVLTRANQKKAKGVIEMVGIAFGVMLAADMISFVVYFVLCGTP